MGAKRERAAEKPRGRFPAKIYTPSKAQKTTAPHFDRRNTKISSPNLSPKLCLVIVEATTPSNLLDSITSLLSSYHPHLHFRSLEKNFVVHKMAQGALKSKPKPKPVANRSGITKKGHRTVAPKKANLIKAQKMTKKVSGGLTAQTERMLGARAGHLEMLGSGGKKGRSVEGNGKGKEKK